MVVWLAGLRAVHFSFHKDPPKSLHCKDKFQVESLVLDPSVATEEDISLTELVSIRWSPLPPSPGRSKVSGDISHFLIVLLV